MTAKEGMSSFTKRSDVIKKVGENKDDGQGRHEQFADKNPLARPVHFRYCPLVLTLDSFHLSAILILGTF